ncbi:glycosyltransferase family 4 protein [Blastococcus sp. CCUG 61487]|uniref:glycosyltransferase family 4 protein n=1 Tax=Blastococcus sp. CCUG 61487 TaxID=1840703 RepID=UPI0010BFF341|nr:glycosyltransferase family 4 protein [Blastococcus sp. CCUG 61487]
MSMRPIKILFVHSGGHKAGGEVVLLSNLRELPRYNIAPVVAHLANGPFTKDLLDTPVDVRLLKPFTHLRDVPQAIGAIRRVRELIVEVRPDVVHTVGESMSVIGGLAAAWAKVPAVMHLHDAPLRSRTSTGIQGLIRITPKACVVVPSTYMSKAYAKVWRASSAVVPNGIDFDDLPATEDIRSHLGWPADTPVIGMFGRLDAWKGHDVLLRAIPSVLASIPEAKVVIVGGEFYQQVGSTGAALRETIRARRLEHVVRVLGHRDDAVALMGGCDVVVHCSTRPEPFGVTVLEALAMGVPVVATGPGGPDDFVPRAGGQLVQANRDDQLSEAILTALADRARAKSDRIAEIRAALGSFSSAATAERLAQVYQDVLKRNPGVISS